MEFRKNSVEGELIHVEHFDRPLGTYDSASVSSSYTTGPGYRGTLEVFVAVEIDGGAVGEMNESNNVQRPSR